MIMKITMKDIAKMAGVSMTTVSLVLNDRESRISKEKKQEIKELAQKYHYVQNFSAVSLAKSTSKTIALIVPNITNPFYASLINVITNKLVNSGYFTLILNSNDNHELENKLVNMAINKGIDGLLLVPSNDLYSKGQKKVESFLSKIDVPYVLVNANSNLKINQINFDNELGGYRATKYLLNHGNQKIAIITGDTGYVNSEGRLKGYKKALNEYHVDYDANLVFKGHYDIQSGITAAKNIERNENITALFSTSDLMLYGVIKYFNEKHIKINDRYSIIGYDNTIFNEIFQPAITSIEQDIFELGKQAVAGILKTIDDQSIFEKTLSVKLVERESALQQR